MYIVLPLSRSLVSDTENINADIKLEPVLRNDDGLLWSAAL